MAEAALAILMTASYMGDVSLVEPEYMRACVVDRVRNAAQKYGVI